ncbi:MAG: YggT family protein [Atopobiaceae bacterium]|nr:YggT family protein [Atopobiaceae bacterium]MBR3314992.1 YggT family protein [Atopobiaceae bacterium]
MFSLSYFISRIFGFYEVLIIIWCILSWLPIPREGILADLVGAIDALVRPYIQLFQRFIPPFGGLDFSPILAILVLGFIERALLVYF